MRIRFARFEDTRKHYILGFWLCIVIGGLAALSSGEHGLWIAEVLLAGAFVCLWGIMAARIRNDYGQQEQNPAKNPDRLFQDSFRSDACPHSVPDYRRSAWFCRGQRRF